jgi:AraC-like DNA-binding protein
MVRGKSLQLFDSVEAINNFFGVKTLNTLVSVINLSLLKLVKHTPKQFNVHSIACYWDDNCEALIGSTEDRCAKLAFYAPGYYGKHYTGIATNPTGYILAFDTELLRDTVLQNRIHEYSFFSNNNDNIILLNKKERDMIYNCMCSINEEIQNPQDKYSQHILAAGINVLLSICMRYYERQIPKPNNTATYIIMRLNNILNNYIHTPAGIDKQIPTVASCASKLGISANYLGDVVRNTIKISAQRYIHRSIFNETKRLLEHTNMSIGQIAYHLGFKHPHYLTRIFKNDTGLTPGQFRKQKC